MFNGKISIHRKFNFCLKNTLENNSTGTIYNGLKKILNQIIDDSHFIDNLSDKNLGMLLRKASKYGYVEVVHKILEHENYYNRISDYDLKKSFLTAIEHNHNKIFNMILDTPNSITRIDNFLIIGLSMAIESGSSTIINRFLSNENLLSKLDNHELGNTLLKASANDNSEVVNMFFNNTKLHTRIPKVYLKVSLTKASELGYQEVINILKNGSLQKQIYKSLDDSVLKIKQSNSFYLCKNDVYCIKEYVKNSNFSEVRATLNAIKNPQYYKDGLMRDHILIAPKSENKTNHLKPLIKLPTDIGREIFDIAKPKVSGIKVDVARIIDRFNYQTTRDI